MSRQEVAISTRAELIHKIWANVDPFVGFPPGLYKPDLQGWNEHHAYYAEAIDALRPSVIVEVGVWKGASSINMATRLKTLAIPGAVVCVDTWLGGSDHWTNPAWFGSLAVEHGQPMLMRTFMTNVIAAGVSDVIMPLPLDSISAAEVLRHHGVIIDMIHIDAGHDYGSVIADLRAWWPLLRGGGMLIGDDYYMSGMWPSVRRAFDEFFGALGASLPLENTGGKCRITKPVA